MKSRRTGLNPRERLINSLEKKRADRPPVVCLGGMMTMATRIDESREKATVQAWSLKSSPATPWR